MQSSSSEIAKSNTTRETHKSFDKWSYKRTINDDKSNSNNINNGKLREFSYNKTNTINRNNTNINNVKATLQELEHNIEQNNPQREKREQIKHRCETIWRTIKDNNDNTPSTTTTTIINNNNNNKSVNLPKKQSPAHLAMNAKSKCENNRSTATVTISSNHKANIINDSKHLAQVATLSSSSSLAQLPILSSSLELLSSKEFHRHKFRLVRFLFSCTRNSSDVMEDRKSEHNKFTLIPPKELHVTYIKERRQTLSNVSSVQTKDMEDLTNQHKESATALSHWHNLRQETGQVNVNKESEQHKENNSSITTTNIIKTNKNDNGKHALPKITNHIKENYSINNELLNKSKIRNTSVLNDIVNERNRYKTEKIEENEASKELKGKVKHETKNRTIINDSNNNNDDNKVISKNNNSNVTTITSNVKENNNNLAAVANTRPKQIATNEGRRLSVIEQLIKSESITTSQNNSNCSSSTNNENKLCEENTTLPKNKPIKLKVKQTVQEDKKSEEQELSNSRNPLIVPHTNTCSAINKEIAVATTTTTSTNNDSTTIIKKSTLLESPPSVSTQRRLSTSKREGIINIKKSNNSHVRYSNIIEDVITSSNNIPDGKVSKDKSSCTTTASKLERSPRLSQASWHSLERPTHEEETPPPPPTTANNNNQQQQKQQQRQHNVSVVALDSDTTLHQLPTFGKSTNNTISSHYKSTSKQEQEVINENNDSNNQNNNKNLAIIVAPTTATASFNNNDNSVSNTHINNVKLNNTPLSWRLSASMINNSANDITSSFTSRKSTTATGNNTTTTITITSPESLSPPTVSVSSFANCSRQGICHDEDNNTTTTSSNKNNYNSYNSKDNTTTSTIANFTNGNGVDSKSNITIKTLPKSEMMCHKHDEREHETSVLTRYLPYSYLNLCMSTFSEVGRTLQHSKVLQTLDLRGSTIHSDGLRGLANVVTLQTVYLSNMKYLTSLLPLVTPTNVNMKSNLCTTNINHNKNNVESNNNNKRKREEEEEEYYEEKEEELMCHLVEIDAHCSSLTDSGIIGIEAFLPHLRLLDLSMNKIRNVCCLRYCHSLQEVSLAVTLVDSHGIYGLEELPQLVYLNLARTRVDSLARISQSASLEVLIVHSCQIHNEDMIGLEQMPRLRELDVSSTKITNLSLLGNSKSLEVIKAQWLSLQNCLDIIQHRRVMSNESLTELESLITPQAREVGYAGLANLPTLTTLDLSFNPIRSVSSLCKSKSLAHLILHRTRINNNGIKMISALSHSLQTLVITSLADLVEYTNDDDDDDDDNEDDNKNKNNSNNNDNNQFNTIRQDKEWEHEQQVKLREQFTREWPLQSMKEKEEEYEHQAITEKSKNIKSCESENGTNDLFGLNTHNLPYVSNGVKRTESNIQNFGKEQKGNNDSNNNINSSNTSTEGNNKSIVTKKQVKNKSNNNDDDNNITTDKNNDNNDDKKIEDNGMLTSIDVIASLITLTKLDLSYTDVYDLRLLEHLKVLHELILIETLVTVDGLRGIEKIPTLTLLDLSQTSVLTLSFLLTGAPKLETIILKSNRNEHGFVIGAIYTLPSLKHLDLSDTVVEDAQEFFNGYTSINNSITSTNSNNSNSRKTIDTRADKTKTKTQTRTRFNNVNYNNINSNNNSNTTTTTSLCKLVSLTWRWHERRDVTGSLPALPCCVESFTLNNTSLIQTLIKLDLSKTNIRDLRFLKNATQLKWLNVSGCVHLRNDALYSLSPLTTLEKISLSAITEISNINCLSTLQRLKELRVNQTSVTLRGVAEVIVKLPQLRVCNLSGTPAEHEFMSLIRTNHISRAFYKNYNRNPNRNIGTNKSKLETTTSQYSPYCFHLTHDLLPCTSMQTCSERSSSQLTTETKSCKVTDVDKNVYPSSSTSLAASATTTTATTSKEEKPTTETQSELETLLLAIHRFMLRVPGRRQSHPSTLPLPSHLDEQHIMSSKNSSNHYPNETNIKNKNSNGSNISDTSYQYSLTQLQSCFNQSSNYQPAYLPSFLSSSLSSSPAALSLVPEPLQSLSYSLEAIQESEPHVRQTSSLPTLTSYYTTLLTLTNNNCCKGIYNSNTESNKYNEWKINSNVHDTRRHSVSLTINHHLRTNSSLADMSWESIDNNNENNNNNQCLQIDSTNTKNECITSAPMEFCLLPTQRVSFVGVDDELSANAGAVMRKVNERFQTSINISKNTFANI